MLSVVPERRRPDRNPYPSEAADDDWTDYAHAEKIDYNLDDVSNRETKVDTPYQGSPATVSYTADNLNQYTLIGANSQVHDDNGNLTDDGTYDFSYDYRNNLVRVAYGAVILSACEFDALGRRTTQVTEDGYFTTVYFYDGEHVVEEYDGSDALLRKFIYGQLIDEIRVMISPDYADVDDDQNTSEVMNIYYHHSLLGTVTHVTDESENVVESYEYTPYGETTIKDINGSTISTSAIYNPYRYTARRQDDSTGLYHYRRRAYDPERGRFLQRDPLGYNDGPNLLKYAASSPTRCTDPLGAADTPIHGDMSRQAAANRGYGTAAADAMATGSESVDEDYATVPNAHCMGDEEQTPEETLAAADKIADGLVDGAARWALNGYDDTALRSLGAAMHPRQDRPWHYPANRNQHGLPTFLGFLNPLNWIAQIYYFFKDFTMVGYEEGVGLSEDVIDQFEERVRELAAAEGKDGEAILNRLKNHSK